MKLRVLHRTRYSYGRPVELQPHRLMMTPRGSHDVTVLERTLECSPSGRLVWSQDVFGNLIATAAFAIPTDELTITSEIIVEQSAVEWPVFSIAPEAHSYPFDYSESEVLDLGALCRPQVPDPQGQLAGWAKGFVLGGSTDTLSLLKDINVGVLAPLTYRVRDEEGTQTPLETLALKSGSCRDIASLFIETVRHLGFAARAVSGYLFDPTAPLDAGGSTHAWAEVYLPSAGWIAFDPTHGRLGSRNLIPTAVGRCNQQIMPVTGGYVGAADDFLSMDVGVQVVEV